MEGVFLCISSASGGEGGGRQAKPRLARIRTKDTQSLAAQTAQIQLIKEQFSRVTISEITAVEGSQELTTPQAPSADRHLVTSLKAPQSAGAATLPAPRAPQSADPRGARAS